MEEAERAMRRNKKKTKKLHHGSNKGNFSSFRNKSFVPNASRSATTGSMDVPGVSGVTEEEESSDGSDSEVEKEVVATEINAKKLG
jgi:hypothetical protein